MSKKKETAGIVRPTDFLRRRVTSSVEKVIKEASERPVFNYGQGSTALGLAIPFPLQYLLGCGVLPLGIMMEINGEQQSCKTMLTYELGRIFADNSGWLEMIVTEGKISEDLAYSIIGWQPERRQAFLSTLVNTMSEWQQLLQTRIRDTIEMMNKGDKASGLPPGATYPVMYVVDSIMGANLPETEKRVQEAGYAGRNFAVEALSLTTYLKTIANLIPKYPILSVFINHLKIDKDENNPYAIPIKRRPGGRQLRFQETFELNLYRAQKEVSLDKSKGGSMEIHRRLIRMENAKNSIGVDGRSIQVYVSWQHRVIGDRTYQFSKWDWNEATVRMLLDFHSGKLNRLKLTESTLQGRLDDFFHIRKLPGGRGYVSDSLNVKDPISVTEMGKRINESPEAIAALRKAFAIPAHNTWEIGTDFVKERQRLMDEYQTREQESLDALRKAVAEEYESDTLNVTEESDDD